MLDVWDEDVSGRDALLRARVVDGCGRALTAEQAVTLGEAD